MIEGVIITPKKKIKDERGAVFHMLRQDDLEFKKFGEIYFSQVFSKVIKGWHLHQEMTLNYLLVSGKIQLALYDERPDSKSYGLYQTFILSDDKDENKLITIPPKVWNAFKGLSEQPSIVANCATTSHDPSEILRKNSNDPYFKYDWSSAKAHQS